MYISTHMHTVHMYTCINAYIDNYIVFKRVLYTVPCTCICVSFLMNSQ